jgi:uncharacterized membrane protein
LIDDQVKGALLVALLIMGLLAGGSYWVEHRVTEPFSELGVLGPNQKIGDYPTTLLVNQNFTLFLYVGDHEGRAMYYDIRVKLGDNSSVVNGTVSLDSPVLADYRVILTDNQTWLQPINLSIDQPGTNLRLVFEMWVYNTTAANFTYHSLYDQLWFNVTTA